MKSAVALAALACCVANAGDIEIGGIGQTHITSLDGVETLDTRLILGAYGESEGAVYGFALQTMDDLENVDIWDAYVGADFGAVDVTVGRFQRHFSAELESLDFGYGYGFAYSSAFALVDPRVEGASIGGEIGDLSFAIDVVGDDVFDSDTATVGGRVELGVLGFGFVGEDMDLWTVDVSSDLGFISYTENGDDWVATAQGVLFTVEDTFSGYGQVEFDHLDETTFVVGGKCEFREGVSALVEYDDRDEGIRAGLRFTF
jgi:hypothetical protein